MSALDRNRVFRRRGLGWMFMGMAFWLIGTLYNLVGPQAAISAEPLTAAGQESTAPASAKKTPAKVEWL